MMANSLMGYLAAFLVWVLPISLLSHLCPQALSFPFEVQWDC